MGCSWTRTRKRFQPSPLKWNCHKCYLGLYCYQFTAQHMNGRYSQLKNRGNKDMKFKNWLLKMPVSEECNCNIVQKVFVRDTKLSNGRARNWPGFVGQEIGTSPESKGTGHSIGPKWWPLESKLSRNWDRWTRIQPWFKAHSLTIQIKLSKV